MPIYARDSNCQLAYLFTEGVGTTVRDHAQKGRVGTFNSAGHPAWSGDVPTYPSGRKAAGSVTFGDAATELIDDSASDSLLPYNAPFSVVAWVNVAAGGAHDKHVVARGSVGFALGANGAGDNIFLFINGATPLAVDTATATVPNGTWAHVAVAYDGSGTAAGVALYVNGVVATAGPTQQNGSGLTSNSGATCRVGNNAAATQPLVGKSTDIGIFNRVLTPTEVNDIYTNGLAAFQILKGGPVVTTGMSSSGFVSGI